MLTILSKSLTILARSSIFGMGILPIALLIILISSVNQYLHLSNTSEYCRMVAGRNNGQSVGASYATIY